MGRGGKGEKTQPQKTRTAKNKTMQETQTNKKTKERYLEKSAVSLHWNQSDAYMILLNTADITGLKISKIGT